MDTLETPTEPVASTAMEAAFMEAASKLDQGETASLTVTEEATVAPETEPAQETKPERPRDELGRFTKTEAGEDIAEADRKPAENAPMETVDASKTASDGKTLSEFEQKKQEQRKADSERKDRSWRALNERREELERREVELERRRQDLAQPRQQPQAPQPREFSSHQLLEAADDFKRASREAFKRYQETGDETALDEFNKNDQLAEQAISNASEFYQIEQQEQQQIAMQKHNQTWVANMEAEIKAMPDLGKPESPIAVEMLGLLKTHGAVFQMLPDGFKQAKEIAQLRLDAKDAPTLREQLKAEKAEVARLTALTQPSGGGVTSAPSKKSFDDMTTAEQEKFLLRATNG